jgi:hypothetical protein
MGRFTDEKPSGDVQLRERRLSMLDVCTLNNGKQGFPKDKSVEAILDGSYTSFHDFLMGSNKTHRVSPGERDMKCTHRGDLIEQDPWSLPCEYGEPFLEYGRIWVSNPSRSLVQTGHVRQANPRPIFAGFVVN